MATVAVPTTGIKELTVRGVILGALITVWFVVYLLAFQAIVVGVMEIVIVLRERALYAKIWPVLVSGVP